MSVLEEMRHDMAEALGERSSPDEQYAFGIRWLCARIEKLESGSYDGETEHGDAVSVAYSKDTAAWSELVADPTEPMVAVGCRGRSEPATVVTTPDEMRAHFGYPVEIDKS